MVLAIVGPLVAAFVYSVAMVLIRRSALNGIGVLTQTVVMMAAMTILPLLGMMAAGVVRLPAEWLWPAVGAGALIVGQVLTLLALGAGDSSVHTPLMGVKVLFVALYSALFFRVAIPPRIWGGALVAAIGVMVIGLDRSAKRSLHGRTILLAAASAATFAVFDAILSAKAEVVGRDPFIAGSLLINAVAVVPAAVVLLTRRRTSRPKPSAAGVRDLSIGSILVAAQFITMLLVIGTYRNGAQANVLYSSRGLWSVVFLVALNRMGKGHHMESADGSRLVRRIVGAVVLVLAVVISI